MANNRKQTRAIKKGQSKSLGTLLQVRLSRLQDVRDDASNQNGGREAKYKNDLQIFFTISKTAKQIKDSVKITFLYTCS